MPLALGIVFPERPYAIHCAVKKVGYLEYRSPESHREWKTDCLAKKHRGQFCLLKRISLHQPWPTYFQMTLFRVFVFGGERARSQPLRTVARHLPMGFGDSSRGADDGEFCFEGHARSAFLRNRIGLCVLQPIKECAGQRCRIQEGEGSWREDVFPFYISPQ
jgi:hypothetical protein